MPSSNFRSRFAEKYEADVKDPILTTLLDTIEVYQEELQDRLLLTVYAQQSNQISDGLFEALRRHLFGQMFPGPAFVVLSASLRNAEAASPVLLEESHYVSIQDEEGSKILFAPQEPVWIVPSQSNDVVVDTYGDDLLLGFNIFGDRIAADANGALRCFMGNADPLLIERLRCRLPNVTPSQPQGAYYANVFGRHYPETLTVTDSFFRTAFAPRFLDIPFQVLKQARRNGATYWLPFQGLKQFGPILEKQCKFNAYLAWNMVRKDTLAIPLDTFRSYIPLTDHRTHTTIITNVRDLGNQDSIEYSDATTVIDSSYPFQFTTSIDTQEDRIVLALHPAPEGEVRVEYSQYNLSESALNIASGKNYVLYQGIDVPLKSVQSLIATQRFSALNDKEEVWNFFRSLLASRNRWLTREDLRSAVRTFPAFGGRSKEMVRSDRISFEERVGRVRGFLTPYTEIVVPVRDRSILSSIDQPYFERALGTYIKARTVNGNFFRIKLVSADDV